MKSAQKWVEKIVELSGLLQLELIEFYDPILIDTRLLTPENIMIKVELFDIINF